MLNEGKALIFFDDECVLCNRFAQWIIRNDPAGYFQFLELKAPLASEILSAYAIDTSQNNSVVLIDKGQVFTESNAALQIVRYLKAPQKYLYYLKIFPRFVRDFVYQLIAGKRYQWFGKTNVCLVDKERIFRR